MSFKFVMVVYLARDFLFFSLKHKELSSSGSQMTSKALSLTAWTGKGEKIRLKSFEIDWDKDMEFSYQLRSQAKQADLGKLF